jgi:uncharacterized membrane protein YjgN (DUF898 family)
MKWYYAHNNRQLGPVSEDDLIRLLQTGAVNDSTLVWKDGLPNWAPLASVAGHLLNAAPSAVPSVSPDTPLSAPVAVSVASAPSVVTEYNPAPAPRPQTAPQDYPFQFHGKTGEYFRIWIVNTALTILTLGIYAAWAKVRTRRYFYGNTTLDGASFDYLANPINILKGNLIMGAMALLYLGSGVIFPPLAILILLLFAIVSPWLIQKAFRFRAHNTSYRNLRFSFSGQTSESYTCYLWLALLVPFTLGLIVPYQVWRTKRFFYGNMSFGKSPFSFSAQPGQFYGIYLRLIGFLLLISFLLALILPALFAVFGKLGATAIIAQAESPMPEVGGPELVAIIGMVFGLITYLLLIIGLSQYIAVRVTNVSLNSTTVGSNNVRFVSQQRLRDVIWLYLTNILAIVLSLGLAIPWAMIRLARYRASKTSLLAPAGGLEFFTAGASQTDSALGDAAADVFDMDIGF